MLFTVGAAMLGGARGLTRQRGGYSLLVLGLFGGSFCGPTSRCSPCWHSASGSCRAVGRSCNQG